MILLIDNYDSFVFNLARYISELGFESQVVRNDKISVDKITELAPTHIILSPGPCTPNEAGICLDVIALLGKHTPILGVCLGHQAIGQAYGAKVTKALFPVHGKSTFITHNGQDLFAGLDNPLEIGRYHSLIVSNTHLPSTLTVTATSEDGQIMGLKHHQYPVYGVQFHPESVLTKQGHQLLLNFLNITQGTLK